MAGVLRSPVPIPGTAICRARERAGGGGSALCVCKHLDTMCAHRHPPTPQELDLQSGSQVNGLFVKRRPAVSNRKHSAPAISPQGE